MSNAQDAQVMANREKVLTYIKQVPEQGFILSGQHMGGARLSFENPENERSNIQRVTGELPAVLGSDFYVSVHFEGAPAVSHQGTVNMLKQHWQEGGIVTASWHQEFPGNLSKGWNFVKVTTSQEDFDPVITPGTELYRLWEKEVDVIAGYLKQLQDAGVPVIFRPYHEMNGNWFWWGAKKPESFHQLWRNMHKRLVEHHGLESLIWCWSPNKNLDMRYYPGGQWVDFTGVDVYAKTRDDEVILRDEQKLKALEPAKVYALTENGRLPTREMLEKTDYAWFLLWTSGWSDNVRYGVPKSNGPGNSQEELKDIYSWEKTLNLVDVDLDAPPPKK